MKVRKFLRCPNEACPSGVLECLAAEDDLAWSERTGWLPPRLRYRCNVCGLDAIIGRAWVEMAEPEPEE